MSKIYNAKSLIMILKHPIKYVVCTFDAFRLTLRDAMLFKIINVTFIAGMKLAIILLYYRVNKERRWHKHDH